MSTSIGNAFTAYAEDKRRREEQVRAEQLAEAQNVLLQQLSRQREYAELAERQRLEAQARLFWRRAGTVLAAIADSLALDLRASKALDDAALPLLSDVLLAFPDASSSVIADNIAPAIAPFRNRSAQLWDEAQKWIDVNQQRVAGLSAAEREQIATAIIEGRTESLVFANGRFHSATVTRRADESLAAVRRNRVLCDDGNPGCNRDVLPPPRQRAYDAAKVSFQQKEDARQAERKRFQELAFRRVASRVTLDADGAPTSVSIRNAITSRVDRLAGEGRAISADSIATLALKDVAGADAVCRLGDICDASLASPAAVATYERLRGERAKADTSAAEALCVRSPIDCDLNRVSYRERARFTLLQGDAVKFPARWRVPSAFLALIAGSDTSVTLTTMPYRQTWAAVGGRAQVSRKMLNLQGRRAILVDFRQEYFIDGVFPRRQTVHDQFVVDANTGAVVVAEWARWNPRVDAIDKFLFGQEAPSCGKWLLPSEGSAEAARSSKQLGLPGLFLYGSILNSSATAIDVTGADLSGAEADAQLTRIADRFVTLWDGKIFGSSGRLTNGALFFSYDQVSAPWQQTSQDVWSGVWALDPLPQCRNN